MSFQYPVVCTLLVFSLTNLSKAQNQSPRSQGAALMERVGPSLALIQIEEEGGAQTQAAGVIVREDGVLLTAHHAVRQARAVQVQLRNGEIFDQVDMIGYDGRRDIAALRISATGLPTVPIAKLGEVRPGQEAYVISHTSGTTWAAFAGSIRGVSMANEIPGAGEGYRVVQFTASVSPGTSGGVLVDVQGRALGIIVGAVSSGQGLNFAVPVESVLGLSRMSGGATLTPATAPPPEAQQAPPAPTLPETVAPPRRANEPLTAPAGQPEIVPINPGAPELSRPIDTRDPVQILRTFRTICINSRTVWLSLDLMQTALQRKPELQAWGIAVVSDPRVADVRLTVNRVLFTWTWTYEMVHQNTGIILGTGKFNATAGGGGASKIADDIVMRISQARGVPAGTAAPKKP